MLLSDAMKEFLYDCECRHLTKGTIRNYRASLSFLNSYLATKGKSEIEEITAKDIRDFMRAKQADGCKPAYINDLLKAYKVMFSYLEEENYISDNIMKKVRNVHQPKIIIETFNEEEIKKLLKYYTGNDFLSIRNKTIIALLFDTGMRCNEMILMKQEDIAENYILVKHGKGNKERVVPKSPYLSRQLIKYIRVRQSYFADKKTRCENLFLSKTGKPLTGEAVARMLKQAAKEVGVSDAVRVSPHTCRHTFAQIQLKNGLDLYSLSRIMGHTNISITQRYLQGLKDKEIVRRGEMNSPLMNLKKYF